MSITRVSGTKSPLEGRYLPLFTTTRSKSATLKAARGVLHILGCAQIANCDLTQSSVVKVLAGQSPSAHLSLQYLQRTDIDLMSIRAIQCARLLKPTFYKLMDIKCLLLDSARQVSSSWAPPLIQDPWQEHATSSHLLVLLVFEIAEISVCQPIHGDSGSVVLAIEVESPFCFCEVAAC